MRIGVLALQGAFREHLHVLEDLGVQGSEVRRPRDLEGLEGLILPGGESTAIGMLMTEYGLREPLASGALPLFGTCAGMILMAERLGGREAPWLSVLDVTVLRNAYGRQRESFEAPIEVAEVGTVRGVFIRAPYVTEVGPKAEVLGRDSDGHPIVVRQGVHLAASFHPELARDSRLHALFLSGIRAHRADTQEAETAAGQD